MRQKKLKPFPGPDALFALKISTRKTFPTAFAPIKPVYNISSSYDAAETEKTRSICLVRIIAFLKLCIRRDGRHKTKTRSSLAFTAILEHLITLEIQIQWQTLYTQ